MIQSQTILIAADNTGVKKILCIRILGDNKSYAKIGDIIIGVVKDALPGMLIKRSDIIRAVVVRTKKSIERKKGGKIGRPKGVGCATRGYGKAMKRGK